MQKQYSLALSLKNPKTVKELHIHLESTNIEDLIHLDKFKAIEELSIYSGTVNKLPDALFELNSLKKLSLSSLITSEIPEDIGKLKNLEELKISDLKITQLPKALGKLKKMKVLDIYECPITEIPKELSDCILLEELSLNTMEIEDVDAIDFSKLKKLTSFSLIKLPKLNTFPVNAFAAPAIEMISVRLTAFEGALPEFKVHPSLRTLALEGNAITRVPESICLLNLSYLNLSSNQIKQLPSKIFTEKLETLRLDENPLEGIPEGFLDWFGSFKYSGMMDFISRRIGTDIFNGVSLDQIHQLVSKKSYRKLDEDTSKAFLNIYINQFDEMEELPILMLYKALQSRNNTLLQNALNFLIRQSSPIKEGARILVISPPQTDLEILNEKLSVYDIQLFKKYNKEISHVLIGSKGNKKLEKLPDDIHWNWITEKSIHDYLDKVQPSFLVEEDAGIDVEKVSQFVFSMEEDNMTLALQLVEAGGLPAELLTELFIIYKFSRIKENRDQAKKLLQKKASPKLAKVLKKRSKLDRTVYYESYGKKYDFRQLFFEFTKDTGLDLGKLAVAHCLRYERDVPDLAVDYSSGKLQEMILGNLIKDERLEILLAYFPEGLLKFPQIRHLKIEIKNLYTSENKTIFKIPPEIRQLKGLEYLSLTHCPFEIDEIPLESLKALANLRKLVLTVNDCFDKQAFRAELPHVNIKLNNWGRMNPS